MRDFEYYEPKSIREAISLLVDHKEKAKVIAGGTDLLVGMKRKVVNPECLINIKTIPHLDSVNYEERGGFKIGALATLKDIESSPLIREKINILAQAARSVGTMGIRTVGTIGGNLCQDSKCQYYARTDGWGRTPCYKRGGDTCYFAMGAKGCQAMATAETAPALICLGARIKVAGPKGERLLPIEELFVSAGVTNLQCDEIILEIEIPAPSAKMVGVYLKHSVRKAMDFAVAGVGVMLLIEGEVCLNSRISLLGVARIPVRAQRAEGLIEGKRIEDELVAQVAQVASDETRPIADIYGSASYRRKKVKELVIIAIEQALEKVQTS